MRSHLSEGDFKTLCRLHGLTSENEIHVLWKHFEANEESDNPLEPEEAGLIAGDAVRELRKGSVRS